MILIKLIMFTLCIIFMILIIKHGIKKCDTFIEQFLLFSVGCTIVFIPSLLLLIDQLDLVTALKSIWFQNINISFWNSFTETYISSLAGGIVGGAFLLFITKLQLDRTKEDEKEALKEEKRLSNLPCIEYNLLKTPEEIKENQSRAIELTKEEKKNIDKIDIIYLKLKNIGINTAKKCAVSIKGESIDTSIFFNIDIQGLLPVNKEKDIIFTIANAKEKQYTYILTVVYEDLMQNKYRQEIKLSYQLKYTAGNNKPHHQHTKVEIDDEQLIK